MLQLWNIVALRVQEIADAASPDYLQLARASSGVRMEALTELADEYSTTLESVLAALRSPSLDDRAARQTATGIAAEGMVHLRTASDRVRTVTEEPVTTAFSRLRDDLRPLVRYREIDVQFVEPPVDGRPLPSEVAHGARRSCAVRSSPSSTIPTWVACACSGGATARTSSSTCATTDLERCRMPRPSCSSCASACTPSTAGSRSRRRPGGGPRWRSSSRSTRPMRWPRPRSGTFVPREQAVLERLVAGRRNRAIAEELGISENTVKFHVARIFRKLGVSSRAEAAALVREQWPGMLR